MMTRPLVILLLLVLGATPLAAQRVGDLRIGAANRIASAVSTPAARDGAEWSDMQPWARHAIVGGMIGGLAGWLLSGLPCEGSAGSCRSAASSILAGAVIGAVVGVVAR